MTAAEVLDDLFDFIASSPSPYHAAATATERLNEAGFAEIDRTADPQPGEASCWRDGGSLIAVRSPQSVDPANLTFRLVGAHTDSPNLRIKPLPDTGSVGYRQLGVEVYGGVLLNSWLDRDLGLSGRVAIKDESGERTELVRVDEPLLRVAQLAIHLDREVNDGLRLDRQAHLAPIWGSGEVNTGGFQSWLAGRVGVESEHIQAWDVMAHDLTPPARLGVDGSFYAAPRIDNLASCQAAVRAIAAASPPDDTIAVVVLFDHEEIGSESATGAAGAWLANSLERIALAHGATRAQYLRSLARSWCVSADGAHAVHPNYLDRHEPNHRVALNAGPVIKLNANVRYASDAESSQRFQAACAAAGVPFQQYSHRTNLACGSTIGPITAARLGLRTVDVGSAQLSMHSAREMGGADDPRMLVDALGAFMNGA